MLLRRYDTALSKLPDREKRAINSTDKDNAKLLDLYRKVGGDFFPFGIRAIALSEYTRCAQLGLPTRLFLSTLYRLWKFYFFTPFWAVAVTVLAVTMPPGNGFASDAMMLAAWIVLFGCLVIAVEAGLSYLTFGGWSVAYHQFRVRPRRSVTEFATFTGGIVSLLFSSQAATIVAAVQLDSYDKLRSTGVVEPILESIYYSITTLSSNGDPGPHTFAGYAVTALQYVESVAFLVIVVSLLFETISRDSPKPDHRPPFGRRPGLLNQVRKKRGS